MIQNIYIIDEDKELYNTLIELFKNDESYCFKNVKESELEIALKNIPKLIIIHEDTINGSVIDICNKIRENDDNIITPVMVISSNIEHNHRVEILKASVDRFIRKPIDEDYLYYTIINIIRLLDINRTVSPLTGLPGNVQIQAEMKKRLINKEEFVMLYLDLDNFKAYNDTYGFIKGDEVIKFTSKTILKNVHEIDFEKGFVGHIGGDDFVMICKGYKSPEFSIKIRLDFEKKAHLLYTETDREKQYIMAKNRHGVVESFPLVSVTIVSLSNEKEPFGTPDEVSNILAKYKKAAKAEKRIAI